MTNIEELKRAFETKFNLKKPTHGLGQLQGHQEACKEVADLFWPLVELAFNEKNHEEACEYSGDGWATRWSRAINNLKENLKITQE